MRLFLLAALIVGLAAPVLADPASPDPTAENAAAPENATAPEDAADAPPVTGLWRLENDNVHVRIVPCGEKLCGRVASSDKLKAEPDLKDTKNQDPSKRDRAVRNLLVMWGFEGGPPKWTGGRIYNPDDGRTYKGEMSLADDDTLKVKGCVFWPLCKSETLTRVR